ncbi:LOW QUALITY PROTEIN: CD209 antigen-like protein C [Puntigrus tetrazona]|uniref:LOW QUALITY PROTEIN: CD209 antigen-like protein C n=1 Tax=Puntigrus tetrazona TaxID=1606681 RepID=UPI001C8A3BAB|nr:LOW QUALITY PROTEIN: CD209 antigen-like protein C [Puntigrus tetrazona]
MAENVYSNCLSDPKPTSVDKDERHCCERMLKKCSVLLFLSLLANGVLVYLYTTNSILFCEPRRHCLHSGLPLDAQPIMKINSMNIKNQSLPNYCSDLQEKWIRAQGRFYVFSVDLMDWNSSRRRCQDLDGDLDIINNEEEQEFLSKRVNGVSDYHWIGLSDSQTEGVWLWVDNSPLNNNLLWDSPPDDWKVENPLQGEDCVILKGEKWGDVSCMRKEKRICEIPCYN